MVEFPVERRATSFLCCPFLSSILRFPMKSEMRQTAKSGRKAYDSTEKQCVPKLWEETIQNIVTTFTLKPVFLAFTYWKQQFLNTEKDQNRQKQIQWRATEKVRVRFTCEEKVRELGLFRTSNMGGLAGGGGWQGAGAVSTGGYLHSGVKEEDEKEHTNWNKRGSDFSVIRIIKP